MRAGGRNSTARVRSIRRRKHGIAGLLATLAAVPVAALLPGVASAGTGLAGSQGTDTSLPLTDSAAKNVPGSGIFSSLRITVNQTTNLVNQAISVTWTGGTPTSNQFNDNFLQIFQCWGDDPAGPPPEQCEMGGEPLGNLGRRLPVQFASDAYSRRISHVGWSTYDPSQGYTDPAGTEWKPFRAVNGTVIPAQIKEVVPTVGGQGQPTAAWQNPFFEFNTTNEDDFGKTYTYANGIGSELFQVDTGLEAPGLGCGQQVEPQPDGSKRYPKCWLVIVPRGTAAQETPPDLNTGYVRTSPLSPASWRNRIVIPLQFNPVDSPCSIGGNERRIVGSELATAAVTNWQPTLCSTPGSPPYAYASIPDGQARGQVGSGAPGAPGMALVSRPFDSSALAPSNPAIYAPLTLSGLVIGFNVERVGNDVNGTVLDPAETPLNGVRVAHINLTPRLVAKALTESYPLQFPNLPPNRPPPAYEWLKDNPHNLVADPDFLQFNPEFKNLSSTEKNSSGLVVEASSADANYELWQWVLADREARAWLAGSPDNTNDSKMSGMRVNPIFSINPAVNPSGSAFGNPVPDTVPKSDPYCFQAGQDPNYRITPRALCMLDFEPYALNMLLAAQETRTSNDAAKTLAPGNDVPGVTPDTYWQADGPQVLGSRFMLSITDSASAARYGLQTASLSRANDDIPNRSFVAPDAPDHAGLLAGAKAMVPSSDPSVLQPNPTTSNAAAYPLTLLTYAAVIPSTLDSTARNDYARFITYAVGPGQTTGLQFGQLVPGYAPLPDELRAQALAAAAAIRNGGQPPGPSSGQPTSSTANSSTSPPGGASGGGSAVPGAGGSSGPSSAAALSKGANGSSAPGTLNLSKAKAIPAASTSRTPWQALGAIRYVLIIALAVGVGAGVGSRLMRKRRRKTSQPNPTPQSVLEPAPGEAS